MTKMSCRRSVAGQSLVRGTDDALTRRSLSRVWRVGTHLNLDELVMALVVVLVVVIEVVRLDGRVLAAEAVWPVEVSSAVRAIVPVGVMVCWSWSVSVMDWTSSGGIKVAGCWVAISSSERRSGWWAGGEQGRPPRGGSLPSATNRCRNSPTNGGGEPSQNAQAPNEDSTIAVEQDKVGGR